MDFSKVCYIPFHGLTIDPSGHLTFCCMDYPSINQTSNKITDRWFPTQHIDDVDDIELWWKTNYKQVWEDYTTNKDISGIRPCTGCFKGINRRKSTTVQESYQRNLEKGKLEWEFDPSDPKIKFLEFTTSNICNQMCVMCSSRHSTQWYDHMPDFNRQHISDSKLLKISDSAIAKIKKLIPQLSHVMIKGGEPLSDMKNLELLEYLGEVNPDCTVAMTSNFQGLTNRHINILKKIKNPKIYVSIDGTNEIFNWIRGGDFNKVDENIKKFFLETGQKVQITITTSIYNFFNTNRIFEHFANRQEIIWFQHHNVVSFPKWCDSRNLPEDIFEPQMIKNLEMGRKYSKICQFDNYFYMSNNPYNPEIIEHMKNYTLKMNLIRGFDITDYVPELRAILQPT